MKEEITKASINSNLIFTSMSNKIIPVPELITKVNANIFFNKVNNLIILE